MVLGSYVKDHDDQNITNNMSPRTHEYISLGPTVNIQGTQKVFCLNSGMVLKRINIFFMISSDQIIYTVKDRGKNQEDISMGGSYRYKTGISKLLTEKIGNWNNTWK